MRRSSILCTLVFFCFSSFCLSSQGNDFRGVFIGSSKTDITPNFPVLLAGYGGRTKEHEGVDTSLWARCLVIGKDDPAVLVVVDNCGITKEIRSKLAQRIAELGVSEKNLVVSATHTHNAPSLRGYAPILWAGRTSPQQEKKIELPSVRQPLTSPRITKAFASSRSLGPRWIPRKT